MVLIWLRRRWNLFYHDSPHLKYKKLKTRSSTEFGSPQVLALLPTGHIFVGSSAQRSGNGDIKPFLALHFKIMKHLADLHFLLFNSSCRQCSEGWLAFRKYLPPWYSRIMTPRSKYHSVVNVQIIPAPGLMWLLCFYPKPDFKCSHEFYGLMRIMAAEYLPSKRSLFGKKNYGWWNIAF